MRKLVFWMPLLFVGSMMFWTVAVGLGGLSLGALLPAVDLAERDIYQPIRVTFGRGPDPAAAEDPAEPGVDDGDSSLDDAAATSEAIQVEPETDQAGTEAVSDGPSVAIPAAPPTAGPPGGPGETAF